MTIIHLSIENKMFITTRMILRLALVTKLTFIVPYSNFHNCFFPLPQSNFNLKSINHLILTHNTFIRLILFLLTLQHIYTSILTLYLYLNPQSTNWGCGGRASHCVASKEIRRRQFFKARIWICEKIELNFIHVLINSRFDSFWKNHLFYKNNFDWIDVVPIYWTKHSHTHTQPVYLCVSPQCTKLKLKVRKNDKSFVLRVTNSS